MGQLFNEGARLTIASTGEGCQINKFLGGGTQGEVYKVTINKEEFAMKWFLPNYLKDDDKLRNRLEKIVKEGPPNDKFVWPLDIIEFEGISGFGYVMPLLGKEFVSLNKVMVRAVEPSFRAIITAALNVSVSFKQLHSKGLCYRDISFNNIFMNPQNGDIKICDNDNVDIEGQPGSILGTPRFMAPEIVRGEANPTISTDLYSLSVIIFYMLMMSHPLEGEKEYRIHALDLPAMRKLYGEEPLFIFDPTDHSNYPVKGYQDNALLYWQIYPQYIRDLFTRAFTDGIHDPKNGRVRESEWIAALIKLRDSIIYCTNCGSENFYDIDRIRNNKPTICWSCKNEVPIPPRLRIDKDIIMLNYDTRIYPHHVSKTKLYDFSTPVAEVTQHPKHPDIWGLKNLSKTKWTVNFPDGEVKEVLPGNTVRLVSGIKINFGEKEGIVKA